MWARIEESRVVEIIDFDPEHKFHKNLLWVKCKDSVDIGYVYEDGIFNKPIMPPVDPRHVRDTALAALVHDFADGRVIQCRPHPFSDESNMRNAIEQMGRLNQTELQWFGADNIAITVTPTDLQAAIESGQDQSATVWAEFFAAIGE